MTLYPMQISLLDFSLIVYFWFGCVFPPFSESPQKDRFFFNTRTVFLIEFNNIDLPSRGRSASLPDIAGVIMIIRPKLNGVDFSRAETTMALTPDPFPFS